MYIKADSIFAILSFQTKRFFNDTLNGNFAVWADKHYANDITQIVEDLTPLMEFNATEKVLQRLGEFDEILDKNTSQISAGVKAELDFHKVFALKTSTKILATLLNL